LARKIGRQKGGFGAFLDSTSDRIAEIILYSGYLSYFYQTEDVWMSIATYAAVTGSIMVSYTRSRAEALGLSCKVGLLTRVERYVVIVATLILSLTVGQRVYHVWRQTKAISSVKSE
jgi:CDP-diacylglycerol--glycerol-3-phosphate 3-phosphatidyltransferase